MADVKRYGDQYLTVKMIHYSWIPYGSFVTICLIIDEEFKYARRLWNLGVFPLYIQYLISCWNVRNEVYCPYW